EYGLRQVREALGRLATLRGAAGLDAWSRLAPEAIVERWRDLLASRLWPAERDRARPLVHQCRRALEAEAFDSSHPKLRERRAALLDRLPLLDSDGPPCLVERLDELVGLLRVNDLPRKGAWPSEEVYEEIRTCFTSLRQHVNDHIKPALV